MTWVPSLVSETYTTIDGQKRDYGTYNFDGDAYYANANKTKINGDCPQYKHCRNSIIKLSWWEAVVFSQDITLNGMTGWRLPTRAELEAILPKLDTAGYPYAHEFLSNCFTTDLGKKAGTVVSYEHRRRKTSTRGFEEMSASNNGNVCLVKGSSQEPHYAKLVERALAWKGESDFPVVSQQATFSAELAAKEAEEGRKYLLGKTDRQLADAAARQKMEQQQKDRLLAFRSNLKPGDRTREGLVLQTKGELVLVQHQEQICVVTNSHGGCNQWRPRETGNQVWVRRNELNLP